MRLRLRLRLTKKFVFMVFTFILFFPILFSCNFALYEAFYRDGEVNIRAASLKEMPVPTPALSQKFKVAIITDIHFGSSKYARIENEFLSWLNQTMPDFVICLGDVSEHGLSNEIEAYSEFVDKIKAVCGREVYTIVGNHDLYNSGWNFFSEKIFPHTSLYHFSTQKFSWYFIDNASGYLGEKQMNVLKNAMRKDSLPKIVSSHIPIYFRDVIMPDMLQDTEEADELITLFSKENVRLVLEGHTHEHERRNLKNMILYNVPGFLELHQWALLSVDEASGTFDIELVN